MNIPEVIELYKNIYIFAGFRYFSLSPGPLAPEVLQPQPLLPGARDPPERTAAAAATTGREQQQRQQQETPSAAGRSRGGGGYGRLRRSHRVGQGVH